MVKGWLAPAILMPLETVNEFAPPLPSMETGPAGLVRSSVPMLKFVFSTVARFAVDEPLNTALLPAPGMMPVNQLPPVVQEVPLVPVQA